MWIYHANDMKYSLIKIYMNVISKEFRILATCAYNKDSSTEMSYSCNVFIKMSTTEKDSSLAFTIIIKYIWDECKIIWLIIN